MTNAKPPILTKPIPAQIVNEGASYNFDLTTFIRSSPESGRLRFSAELATGESLPAGLICTESGQLSGIPAKETEGNYDIVVLVENDSGIPLAAQFAFTIRPRMTIEGDAFLNEVKSKIWEALGKNLPLPEVGDLFNRPVSALEIYYLLQQFAFLTIWDVYNLDIPGEKVPLKLEGASSHYDVYDRGSCLVATPKDLFSHERTLVDALKTAEAMAREVYQRGWTIEFSGFNKMVRAAWVELQHLSDKHGKAIEIMHYSPSMEDIRIYASQTRAKGLGLG